ncbi:MAG: triphosphoribosyl-dephospho-CoA synthase [Rubrobacteraceae bacterium]
MEPEELMPPVPAEQVADCAATVLTISYSAPMPGLGSRYQDTAVAHETRLLTVTPVQGALAGAGTQGVGETVLSGVLASRALAGFADVRAAGYLAPLARGALLGMPFRRVLSTLGAGDVLPVIDAFVAAGQPGPFSEALRLAHQAGGETTLRDVARFVADRDPLAREYARGFEIPTELAGPAILEALSRAESARAALVHSYLEVLAEVPDLDIIRRAGDREAEDVARMARGVVKSGSVYSRRGIQSLANLDGLLREDPRLAPTATESPVIAAAFLLSLEYGPGSFNRRLNPVTGGYRGR